MRNFVVAALIGSTAVEGIRLNSKFWNSEKKGWQGSNTPIEWHAHGEYDTSRFEQDYVDAKNNFTEKRREMQEEFDKQANKKRPNFEIPNIHPEAEYARDYSIAKSLERMWNGMTPEEQARFKSYHDWTEQYPYYDMFRGYPEGDKKDKEPVRDSFVQTNASVNWLDFEKNQLTWEESQGDKIKDLSEWHDADFTFTKDHPDWGMDDNVKHYFEVAQQRTQFKGVKFDGDTVEYEAKYRALKANETKKAEMKKAYDWPKNAEEQQRANAEEFGTLEPKKKWAYKNETSEGESKKEEDAKEKKNATATKEDTSKKGKSEEEPMKENTEEPAKDKKKSEEKPTEDDKNEKAKKEDKKSEEKSEDQQDDKKEKKAEEKPKEEKEEKESKPAEDKEKKAESKGDKPKPEQKKVEPKE